MFRLFGFSVCCFSWVLVVVFGGLFGVCGFLFRFCRFDLLLVLVWLLMLWWVLLWFVFVCIYFGVFGLVWVFAFELVVGFWKFGFVILVWVCLVYLLVVIFGWVGLGDFVAIAWVWILIV